MFSSNPAIQPASRLSPQSLSFLWPGRLPLGKLAILDGDPGLGKSLVTLDLCSRLSTGRPWPDGATLPAPANSIVLNAEDSAADTIVPRLKGLGADLDRVFVLNLDQASSTLRITADFSWLDQIIQTTSAKLVVFDPILAFLDSWFQAATDTGIRHAFFPLSRLAQKHQCAILLVRHLTKSGSRRALYRGGGSIGLLAACRSAWLIVEDPENSANRVLAQIKNNVGPPQPSLGYSILAGPEQTPTIAWLPGFRPFEADDLLARLGSSRAFSSPFARASNFLKDFLRDGPKTSREIWTAAGEFDLSKRTLKRAKKKLQIRSQRVRLDERSVSYWLLKDQELPAKFSSSSVVPDLEPWLKSLREKFPLPTPLDDL